MKSLDEILEETQYTDAEYETFKKVLRHFQAEDLQYRLDDQLDAEYITQEQYEEAKERADEILERYDKTNEDE